MNRTVLAAVPGTMRRVVQATLRGVVVGGVGDVRHATRVTYEAS
ncbi:hypothetical protein AAH978_16120 [Streptomyces sp. ZYX-F-203]